MGSNCIVLGEFCRTMTQINRRVSGITPPNVVGALKRSKLGWINSFAVTSSAAIFATLGGCRPGRASSVGARHRRIAGS